MIELKSLLPENINVPFAVFVLAPVGNGYAATTRPADRGESGKMGLPGGKIDPNENVIDAAYREANEEGWQIINIDPIPIQKRVIDGKLILYYKAESAKILTDYKEKGRIVPFVASAQQIKSSGYGNDTLIK